jgi:hypothetical protein
MIGALRWLTYINVGVVVIDHMIFLMVFMVAIADSIWVRAHL